MKCRKFQSFSRKLLHDEKTLKSLLILEKCDIVSIIVYVLRRFVLVTKSLRKSAFCFKSKCGLVEKTSISVNPFQLSTDC